jgi:hypothetical protein
LPILNSIEHRFMLAASSYAMQLRYFVFAVLAGLFFWHFADEWPAPTSGVLAPDPPVQTSLASGDAARWNLREFKITPLARYSIKARIMHRESYWFDYCANLSPLDFALGWSRMSDPAVYGKLHISQGSRWYTWYWWGTPPIPEDQIPLDSANTHLIPGDKDVGGRLSDFRAGDVVQLSGYLVRVDGPNGWHWDSSLSRSDTGDGSCEVMWVKDAKKVGR